MTMGLTTGLWVMAQVRLCDRAFIPAAIVRRTCAITHSPVVSPIVMGGP